MAEPSAYLDQLRATFTAELGEREREMNRLLLRLEREVVGEQERSELLAALFREAHSLKGAARAVELPPVEKLAHALESALDNVRRPGVVVDRAWFDTAYRAVDAFGSLRQSFLEGECTFPPDIAEVFTGLGANGNAVSPSAAPAERAATELLQAARESTVAVQPGPAVQPEARRRLDHALPDGAVSAPEQVPGPTEREASAAPSPAAGSEQRPAPAAESIRVAVSKLDALLSQAGELAVTRIRVDQRLAELRELHRELESWRREWRESRATRTALRRVTGAGRQNRAAPLHELEEVLRLADRAEQRAVAVGQRLDEIVHRFAADSAQLGVVTHAVQDDVMSVRLLPVSTILAPFARMVRDLSHQKSKEAHLVLDGVETEIDRRILEQLRDPLMHMLRNAVDHGIEPPEERLKRGKSRAGTVRLAVVQRGGVVELELSDDGAGINPDRVRQTAVQRGFLTADQAESLDDKATLELIFEPGFSTSAVVTDTSGRGVGMDVVREHIDRLNGHVKVVSVPGEGTRLTMTVPLTLATTRAVLVEQGGRLFAVPEGIIQRTARVRRSQLVSVEGRTTVTLEGRPVPLIELAAVLDMPAMDGKRRDGDEWKAFLVLQQGDRRVAILAERLVGEQELVVKRLSWPLRRVRNVGGAAVLGSGEIAMILNPADMLRTALRLVGSVPGAERVRGEAIAPKAEQRRPRLLVVDDALTTRTLERSILEAAGYEVVVATDGLEALNVLRGGRVDLVVSDIEMPRMDGFSLTAEIRRDEQLRRTPVVLVTSMDAQEHRERGMAVGADAYITKGRFDQGELLDTVSRLL